MSWEVGGEQGPEKEYAEKWKGKKKGKRLITERCKVTPWLLDLDQLPATWIKLASYSQQTLLLLSKLKYVMYALVITVPNLGINTLFHYEFIWLSQNLTEFNQINFCRCRSDQNIVWYGILHAILIFSSLLGWNLKEEEYFFYPPFTNCLTAQCLSYYYVLMLLLNYTSLPQLYLHELWALGKKNILWCGKSPLRVSADRTVRGAARRQRS